MDLYNLNVNTSNIGGYFSSEQLEMLSIIQCQTYEEIISFVYKCKQLNEVFTKNDLQNFVNLDLEQVKRNVFKKYQDTLVPHDSSKQIILDNTLHHLGIFKVPLKDSLLYLIFFSKLSIFSKTVIRFAYKILPSSVILN